MSASDLAEALYQIASLKAEKGNLEALNTTLISEITKLEKKVTDLFSQLKTAQSEKDAFKSRSEKYQQAYRELSNRLGTYDTQLIEKLESRANRAEAELRRISRSPEVSEQLQSLLQAQASSQAAIASLQAALQRSRTEVETLVDQLTTEIANSAKVQEDFQRLKERYQALYRENRQDAVGDPIAAPDPQDTPRLPYRSPSLKLSLGKIKPRLEVCSLCGQPLPLQS